MAVWFFEQQFESPVIEEGSSFACLLAGILLAKECRNNGDRLFRCALADEIEMCDLVETRVSLYLACVAMCID